jgi:hypothetical protein
LLSFFPYYVTGTEPIMDTKSHPPDENWRRQSTVPEEDLPPCITAKRKPGEHRWFRSDNVIPIERYQRKYKGGSCEGGPGTA